MNKAWFSRKAIDIDELKNRTGEERDKVSYVVEKVIELPDDQFKEVCDDLFDDYDFLEENTDLMYVDKKGIWHVLLVKSEDRIEAIIVDAEGYTYFRYASYIPDCTEVLRQFKNQITDKIFDQIMDIRESGVCNMLHTDAVQNEAFRKEYYDLVILIEENKKDYVRFIMTGER